MIITPYRDYADWLTPERLEAEIKKWEAPAHVAEQALYASEVTKLAWDHNLTSVEEWGCGIGWLAKLLPERLEYRGYDKYLGCIEEARRRNPGKSFHQEDIEAVRLGLASNTPDVLFPGTDIVVSFSMLKHFAMERWPDICAAVLSRGRYGVLHLRGAKKDEEEEGDFPCVWVSMNTIDFALEMAGHEQVKALPVHAWGDRWEGLLITRSVR